LSSRPVYFGYNWSKKIWSTKVMCWFWKHKHSSWTIQELLLLPFILTRHLYHPHQIRFFYTFSINWLLNNAVVRQYQIIWYSLVNTILLGYLYFLILIYRLTYFYQFGIFYSMYCYEILLIIKTFMGSSSVYRLVCLSCN